MKFLLILFLFENNRQKKNLARRFKSVIIAVEIVKSSK